MDISYSRSNQIRRTVNLVFQILIVCLLFFQGIAESVAFKFILWQIVHFSLIAIADFYLDDFPGKTRRTTFYLFIIYLLFIGFSIFLGIFDELFIRIHGIILILGNVLGKKVDQVFWKLLTLINLIVLVHAEWVQDEFRFVFDVAGLYILGAICLLALTERLSEINRNYWILHSIVLFLWITFRGPFYQEAFLFLIGGISYESFKIVMNKNLQHNLKFTSKN